MSYWAETGKLGLQPDNLRALPVSGRRRSATLRQECADDLLDCTAKKGFILGEEFLHTLRRNKPSVFLLVKPRETVISKRATCR